PPYLVMEYIEGRSLAEIIFEDGPLELDRAIAVLIQVCQALKHAHDRGVIHRDLKPGNILLQKASDGTDVVKIVDFGIAKVNIDDSDSFQNFTRTGEILGSPLYMSPEQCTGQKLDRRTDIYSLGCVLYAMLTGRPPFQGETTFQTIEMHLHEQPVAISARRQDLPHAIELDNILFKAMAKDPEQRYQSFEEFEQALKQIGHIEGFGGLDLFLTIVDSIRRRAAAQKHRGIPVNIVLLYLALVGGVAVMAMWQAYDRILSEESMRRWPEMDRQGQIAFDNGNYSQARRLFNTALKQAKRSENQTRINSSLEELVDLHRVLGDEARVAELESQLRPTQEELSAGLKTMSILAEANSRLEKIRADSKRLSGVTSEKERQALLAQIGRGYSALIGDCRHVLVRKQNFQTLSIASGTMGKKCLDILLAAKGTAEKIYGPDHTILGRILHNLAMAYMSIGDPEMAVETFRKADKILGRTGAIPPLEMADYLDDEALFYNLHADFQQAVDVLQRELKLAGGVESDSPTAGIICNELAAMYHRLHDAENARYYADEALRILEKSQDQQLDRTRAWLHLFKGEFTDCVAAAQRALDRLESEEVKDYWDLSEVLALLADAYLYSDETKSVQKAEPLVKRVIAISVRTNEPFSQLRRTIMLARVYGKLNKANEQIATYERAIPMAERLYGKASEGLSQILIEAGDAKLGQGHYEEARADFARIIKMCEDNEHLSRKKLKAAYEGMAKVEQRANDLNEAEKWKKKAEALQV
ncbi:MAG TPA: protein kinase, partial [Candidatus Obscuribacterales bacterium]